MIEARCSEQQPEVKKPKCLKFSDLYYDDVDECLQGTGSIEAPGPMKRDLSTKRLRPSTAMGLNSPHRRGIPPRPGSVPLGETRSGLAGTARLGVGALGEGLGSSKPMPKSERKPLMRSRGKRESASSLPRKVPKEEYHVQIDTDTMTYDDL